MKRNQLLEKVRERIRPEIKREIDLSFEVADRIFAILQQQGKTQKDLADLCGKHESEISKWLSGGHNFTIQTIAFIESKLGERILEVSGKRTVANKFE